MIVQSLFSNKLGVLVIRCNLLLLLALFAPNLVMPL